MGMYFFKNEDMVPVTEETLGGDQKSIEVINPEHASKCPMYAGVSEFTKDNPPSLFAHDDVGNFAYIMEGELIAKCNQQDDVYTAKPGDLLYFTQTPDMRVELSTPDYCKLFWAAYCE